MQRLFGVGRERPAMRDVAERAAPRADVAEDHEGCGALAEALADVRAGSFLAHGVQALLAQDALDLMEARAGQRRAHADPGGLGELFARMELQRRSFARALLLDAGFTHARAFARTARPACRRERPRPPPCRDRASASRAGRAGRRDRSP